MVRANILRTITEQSFDQIFVEYCLDRTQVPILVNNRAVAQVLLYSKQQVSKSVLRRLRPGRFSQNRFKPTAQWATIKTYLINLNLEEICLN
jgi:hypothetical protein